MDPKAARQSSEYPPFDSAATSSSSARTRMVEPHHAWGTGRCSVPSGDGSSTAEIVLMGSVTTAHVNPTSGFAQTSKWVRPSMTICRNPSSSVFLFECCLFLL